MNITDAFMISVGLDATAFVKGQKEAMTSLAKTKDAAASSGKAVEGAAKGMTEGLSKTATAALELVAIFTGGKTFKDFIEGAAKANTAVGLLSTSLGATPELVGAWGIAAQRMGGSAAMTQASLQKLSDSLVDLRLKGDNLPQSFWILSSKVKGGIDFSHGLEKMTIGLAHAAAEMAKTDPLGASRLLRDLVDPATAALLLKQGDNMAAYIRQQKKLAPSKADVQAAKDMTDAQGHLSAAYDLLAAKVMTALSPALTWLAEKLSAVIEKIAGWVSAHPKLVAAITGVVALLVGAATVAAIASVGALTAGLLALSGVSFVGLLAGLAALGLTGIAGVGIAALAGVFDEAKAGESDVWDKGKDALRKKMQEGTGNDAIRRRGHDADIALGKNGKLTDNQKEAYASARAEGLNDKAARALVADMSGEALSKPHDVHWDGKHFAHGVAQWDDERSARIKEHFGKMPQDMSVADQTKAAIWEIRTNPRFAKTKRALSGDNAGDMIGALVGNYEGPRNVGGAIAERTKIYRGLGNLRAPDPLWTGMPHVGGMIGIRGAAHSAALSNISNDYRATTSSSSNETHINGGIHINAPRATDSHGIASSIDEALKNNAFANAANYGPA